MDPRMSARAADRVRQVALLAGAGSLFALGATADYGHREELRSPAVPAGPAFAIWLPIFAGTIGLVARHSARAADPVMRRIGWPLAAVLGAAGVWERTFEARRPALALALIGGTWLAASVAYARLPARDQGASERWLVRAPTGLLYGWLTVAAAAGGTEQLLEPASGLDLDPEPLALGAIAALGVTGAAVTVGLDRTRAYPAAVAWGLGGILAAEVDEHPSVAVAAGIALVGIGLAALAAEARRRRAPVTSPSSSP